MSKACFCVLSKLCAVIISEFSMMLILIILTIKKHFAYAKYLLLMKSGNLYI